MMHRRNFIALLGGAATFAPLAAHAQQRMRLIGLVIVNENDAEGQGRMLAFRNGLAELGWIEGQNIKIEYRWGAGNPERAQAYVTELLALSPDIVMINGTPMITAFKRATRDIPAVFVMVTDPVGAGIVDSLARPGANITGFSTFEPEIGGKWLELLRALAPNVRRVGAVLDPPFKGFADLSRAIETYGRNMGVEVEAIGFHQASDDIESAIGAFAAKPDGALIILPTAINSFARARIMAAAARHRLPAIYPFRQYATEGGLLSYGLHPPDLFARAARYVDRILKGEKPADLPVQGPTKFETVVNLKTAKALGITVPPTLLATADEVIE
jgi:putative ABC transport system substrate-binding protein